MTVGGKTCLEAAQWWIHQGVAVVPMRPALAPSGRGGKATPLPWIRWQKDGPLRIRGEVDRFWMENPSAQLAIVLEDGLAAVDIDLKKLPMGRAPEGHPVPDPVVGGYVETTKSGGLHYLVRFRQGLDPAKASRVTELGGYVDVFHGGLLIVAPTTFEGAVQPYRVVRDGGIPVFPSLRVALDRTASWLGAEWEAQWARSASGAGGSGGHSSLFSTDGGKIGMNVGKLDLTELEKAVQALRSSERLRTLCEQGAKHPNGEVDRSLTEFQLAAHLKRLGFSRETVLRVVQLCPHTKSPTDPRGAQFFDHNIWARLR